MVSLKMFFFSCSKMMKNRRIFFLRQKFLNTHSWYKCKIIEGEWLVLNLSEIHLNGGCRKKTLKSSRIFVKLRCKCEWTVKNYRYLLKLNLRKRNNARISEEFKNNFDWSGNYDCYFKVSAWFNNQKLLKLNPLWCRWNISFWSSKSGSENTWTNAKTWICLLCNFSRYFRWSSLNPIREVIRWFRNRKLSAWSLVLVDLNILTC